MNNPSEGCPLSAIVAQSINADMLILLSDIDGLYTANPKEDKTAEFIQEVDCVTEEVLELASGVSDGGRGGMKTKLEAAKLVTRFGGKVLIANGKTPYVISKIFNAENIGMLFISAIKASAIIYSIYMIKVTVR